MADSKPLNSSTVYDPYTTIQLQNDNQGYGGSATDKQGSVAAGGAVSGDEGSGKESKTAFELEQPRSQEPMQISNSPGKWSNIMWIIRYFLTVVLVGFALCLPVIILRDDRVPDEDNPSVLDAQYRNLIFYLFLWLAISWAGACLADMLILAFPYIFRFVAG